MRVITGLARGKALQTLEGLDTRPTSARVKEGLFSAIQFDIEGRMVLDLFAGSGQLGIEALSRGAAFAVFVDSSVEAVNLIKSNLKSTGLFASARVAAMDAAAYLSSASDRFDLVLLDPPYRKGLVDQCLKLLAGRLKPGGLIVCETGKDETVDPAGFTPHREYLYGSTKITILQERAGE